MPAPESELTLLLDAARKAGRIALKYFRRDPKTWDKPGAGPVTEADLAVDAYLHQTLRAARPDYGWLSEETADHPARREARLKAQRTFIVDPIDGTRAFIAGEGSWAVVLAVVTEGTATDAVVHLPSARKTYAATQSRGANLNGTPIHVSERSNPDGGRIMARQPVMRPEHWPGGLPQMRRGFRPALAYRMALVAEGRYDATLTLRPTWDWDAAAGALLIAEAGGAVTDAAGKPLRFNSDSGQVPSVVGAGACHDRLIAGLTGHSRI